VGWRLNGGYVGERERVCVGVLKRHRDTGCELRPPANSENLSRILRLSSELYQRCLDESWGMMEVKESLRGVEGWGVSR